MLKKKEISFSSSHQEKTPSEKYRSYPPSCKIIKLERERKRNVIFHIKWCLSTHGNDVSHAEQTRQKFLIINKHRMECFAVLKGREILYFSNKYIAAKENRNSLETADKSYTMKF